MQLAQSKLMNGINNLTTVRRHDLKFVRNVGIVSTVAIVIGSLSPSVPFTSKIPGSWFFGIANGPLSLGILPSWLAQAIFYFGFISGLLAWLWLVQLVMAKEVTTKQLIVIGAIWFVPLAIAGPLYSRDIYSYAAIGEMVSRHISPYQYGPNILGATPYLNTVDPFWGNAPAPYGPLFLWFSGVAAVVTQHNPFATMLFLRVATVIAVLAIIFSSMRIAEILGKDKRIALVLIGLNPIVIFHLASSGHNDAFMIAFMTLGLLMFYKGHSILATVLISAGAAVKVPAVIALAFIAWNSTAGNKIKDKIIPSIKYGSIALATVGAISYSTGLGWGWIHNLGTPGTVRSPAVPTTALAAWSDRLTSLLGIPLHFAGFLTLYRALGLLGAALITLYFAFHLERFSFERAIGYSLLALVLLGPVIQPWYIAWGLIFVAISPSERVVNGVVVVTFMGMMLGLPDGPMLVSWTVYIIGTLALVGYLGVRYQLSFIPSQLKALNLTRERLFVNR
ncbi:polyprenol phosphomannose-dependent alpha 1,6 mannosyltransferase MptB [Acidithrix ferrooxidans]|uniref:Alpha-(1->6)-mannopyranosyltransferase A n=1 Tax=Acidithrix ferrooxidans TaxID=1280514 RepID=A0A0D8HLI7_9ACTN|nr:polyprenol phosphomannose-dependent alpha 1,6 mannosyltransferase MptB [Acidithrix ferrooxidans]KJF18607.1 hypothetical protein AXFE_05580 [Acidithrix ferrooxidans]